MMKKTPRRVRTFVRLAAVGALGLAAVLLGPATAHASVAERVQSGTVTNTANGTCTPAAGARSCVQIVTITGVDPAKSFLIFESRHNSNRPVASLVRGRIPTACANPCTTIEFVRVTDEAAALPPATINIQWYVVTFVSGVTVQRGETAQTATTVNLGAAQGFAGVAALNRAFVLFSKTVTAGDTTWDGNDPVVAELTTTTNLQFQSDAAVATHLISWQVVEFASAADGTVQTGTLTTMNNATLSVTATLGTAVDVNKTFVLVSFRTPGSAATAMGSMMLRARLTNSTTITIDRVSLGPPTAITEINWQAIELEDASVVVGGTSAFASTVGVVNVPMVPHVDTSRAIAFGSVQNGGGQNMGRSADPVPDEDILGVGAATMALSATQLTLTRTNTTAAADIGWFVVEFEQADEAYSPVGVLYGERRGRALHRRRFHPRCRHRQGQYR